MFNAVVENRDYFIGNWEEQIESDDVLKKVIAKRFIGLFKIAMPIKEFDCERYFKLVEKITVFDGKLIVSLHDGSGVDCAIKI